MSVSVSSAALRLAAAVATAGALVATVALPASAADHAPRSHRENVSISRVQPDSRGHDHHEGRYSNHEWVELSNAGHRAVSLNGWTLSDAQGHTYTFRHHLLDGRSTVRLHTGFGRDTHRDLFQDRRTGIWDRRDSATLRNDHHRVVDTLTWGAREDHHGRDDRHDPRDDGRDHRGGNRGDHRDHRGDQGDRDHRR